MEHIPSDLSPPDRDLRPPDHSQSALFMLIQTILQLQPARGTHLYFTVAMPSHACNYQSDGRLKVPLRTNSPVALVFVESSAPPVLMASASISIAQPPHQKAIPIRRTCMVTKLEGHREHTTRAVTIRTGHDRLN